MTQRIQAYPTSIGPNVSYGDFVRNLFRPLAPSAMLAHAAMGVVTEVQEAFDATTPENSVEEAGDIAFFCAAFIQNLPHQVTEADVDPAMRKVLLDYCLKHELGPTSFDDTDVFGLMQEVSVEMLDAAKRYLAYDKPPTQETCTRLVGCAEMIAGLALTASPSEGEANPQNVIDVNVAKLKTRYKAGFSTEAAVNRDVATEAEVIQRAVAG